MRRVLAVLAMAAALMVPAAAAAQSLDSAALSASCEANAADDIQLATCQWVVATVLAPSPRPSPMTYGADLPGPGVTLARDDAAVTLVDVDWNAKGTYGKPDKGTRYVALRVLYEATAGGASYNPLNWTVVDLEGFEHDRLGIGGKEPDLSSSNDLPVGRKAQGWVTFTVPKNVHQLEVVESQFGSDYLRWLITEPD